MLKPALQLKLGQQLTMTPQLQQAIRLLQLPVLELQAQIREALESNVMLESEEEDGVVAQEETGHTQNEFDPAPAGEPTAAENQREEQVEMADDTDWTDAPISGPS